MMMRIKPLSLKMVLKKFQNYQLVQILKHNTATIRVTDNANNSSTSQLNVYCEINDYQI